VVGFVENSGVHKLMARHCATPVLRSLKVIICGVIDLVKQKG